MFIEYSAVLGKSMKMQIRVRKTMESLDGPELIAVYIVSEVIDEPGDDLSR